MAGHGLFHAGESGGRVEPVAHVLAEGVGIEVGDEQISL